MIRRTLFPSPVHRRLAPLTAASFFGGIALWVPVEKLFLAEIGFTPQTIGVMAAAYAAVVPLLEIPSGILADRWSRRGVLLIGNAGMVLSVLVGGLSTNVATYVVAALLLGVYFAMQSGTFDAIVYDTVLEETGDSDRFEAIVGPRADGRERVARARRARRRCARRGHRPRVTYFATVPFLLLSTAFLSRSASLASTRPAKPGRCANTSRSPSGSFAATDAACRSPLCSCSPRSSPRPSSSSARSGSSTPAPEPAPSGRRGPASWRPSVSAARWPGGCDLERARHACRVLGAPSR